MKTIIIITAVLFASSLNFSCKKSSPEKNTYPAAIVGKWDLTGEFIDFYDAGGNLIQTINEPSADTRPYTYTFKADGVLLKTVTQSNGPYTYTHNWWVFDGKFYIDHPLSRSEMIRLTATDFIFSRAASLDLYSNIRPPNATRANWKTVLKKISE